MRLCYMNFVFGNLTIVRGWCPHQSLKIRLVGTPTEDNSKTPKEFNMNSHQRNWW